MAILKLLSTFSRLSLKPNKFPDALHNFQNQNICSKRSLPSNSHPMHHPRLSEALEKKMVEPPTLFTKEIFLNNFNRKRNFSLSTVVASLSLKNMHEKGPVIKRKKRNPLDGKPFAKGIVLRLLKKKPKKPNSANRKCVLVRLSTGKEMVAYVPGEGHNLQEHHTVLVRVGRLRDVPGVKLKCVRGAYDLNHVVKKK